MKRRVTIVLLSLVLVGSLVGITAVGVGMLGPRQKPYVSPPPWQEGEPLTPQPTRDHPQLISVARAQQIEEWIRTREMNPTASAGYDTWTRTLSFQEEARRGDSSRRPIRPGLVAGQQVRGDWSEDDTAPRISESIFLNVQLFETSGARDQALLPRSDKNTSRLPEPKVAGATAVLLTHRADSCVQGGSSGQLDTVTGSAAVGELTLVSTGLSCFAADDVDHATEVVTASLTKAVKTVAGLEDEPIPSQLFDLTDDVPGISSGSWQDKQIVVDESLGPKARLVLPAGIPDTGVEALIRGRDLVVVMDTAASADRFLQGLLTESHQMPAKEESVDYAARQICRAGEHYQQATTCWTRQGRFIVISRSKRDAKPDVEDQLDLLRK